MSVAQDSTATLGHKKSILDEPFLQEPFCLGWNQNSYYEIEHFLYNILKLNLQTFKSPPSLVSRQLFDTKIPTKREKNTQPGPNSECVHRRTCSK